MWGVSRLTEKLLASQEGLCSMELVSYLRKVIDRARVRCVKTGAVSVVFY
jgi:hypothetical protein